MSAHRHRYSRWDGTQQISSISADDIAGEWAPIRSANRTVLPTVTSAARSLAASLLDPLIRM